jgi:hypothetical protein
MAANITNIQDIIHLSELGQGNARKLRAQGSRRKMALEERVSEQPFI